MVLLAVGIDTQLGGCRFKSGSQSLIDTGKIIRHNGSSLLTIFSAMQMLHSTNNGYVDLWDFFFFREEPNWYILSPVIIASSFTTYLEAKRMTFDNVLVFFSITCPSKWRGKIKLESKDKRKKKIPLRTFMH